MYVEVVVMLATPAPELLRTYTCRLNCGIFLVNTALSEKSRRR